MGMLTGAMSFRRYRVLGDLPADFRDRFLEALSKHAFVERDRARTREENIGWVSIEDPDDSQLSIEKWLFGQHIVLSMRVDRKRVPAKYMKIQVNRRVLEEKETRGVQRVSAVYRRELAEAIEEELLGRALPTVATFDFVWEFNKMEVWWFVNSDAMSDLCCSLFRETFELDLQGFRLSDWVGDRYSDSELETVLAGLAQTPSWRAS